VQTVEAARLRQERDRLEKEFRSLEARSMAANEAKEKQL
jgi:BMFP domain-containing protein YqiC